MSNKDFDEVIDACIVCSSKKIKLSLIDYRQISISKCEDCGFQFMNPQYTDEYLTEYYSNYTSGDDFDYWHEALLYGHDFYLSKIEKFINVGKMLDVGCGGGYLLEAAINRGWAVRGFDVDDVATSMVSERIGVEIDSGDFFSTKLDEDYDLVTMHQVLEHVKDPNKTLGKISSCIRNGGYIFVAVPNIKSLANRLKRYLEQKGVRKNNIGKYYDSSHHLLYFEPDTLKTILANNGFQVVYQRNCHSTRPGQSKLKRFIMRNLTDYLFAKSAFFVIAKKIR